MIKLCVFDLDGTLVNSLTDLCNAMNYALEKNNFPTHHIDAYKKFVGSGIFVLIERATANTNATQEDRAKIHKDFNEYYTVHCMDNTAPYKGCCELLEALSNKGILIGVLSNKPHIFTQNIVKNIYTNIKFSAVWGKQDGIEKKPHPQALNMILKELNIKNDECMYIGDSDVDVLTARNANVHFCGVDWGFRGYDELKNLGAEYIVLSADEILDIVENC